MLILERVQICRRFLNPPKLEAARDCRARGRRPNCDGFKRATIRKLTVEAQAAPRGGSLKRTVRQSSWWCQDIHLRCRVVSRHLIRAALAAVWLYQGLWCKLLGGCGRHAEIVASLSMLGATAAHGLLLAIGGAECALAIWILAGVQLRAARRGADLTAGGNERRRPVMGRALDCRPRSYASTKLRLPAAGVGSGRGVWKIGAGNTACVRLIHPRRFGQTAR